MRSRPVCRTAAPCCAAAVAEQAAAAPGPSALVRDGDDDLRRGEDRSGQDNLAGYPDPDLRVAVGDGFDLDHGPSSPRSPTHARRPNRPDPDEIA